MSPAMMISKLLHDHPDVDLQEGTSLFIGREPESPDSCVTIYDTGGSEQESRLAIDEATFQIRVRSKSYDTGYQKAGEIKSILQSLSSVSVEQILLVGLWASSNIAFLKRDDQDRSIFVWNGRVMTEPTNLGNRQ